MSKERSEFDQWYEAQYGPCPGDGKHWDEVERDYEAAGHAYERAKAIREAVRGWFSARDVALKAWQAGQNPGAWKR